MDLEVARDGLVDLLEKRQDVCGGVRLAALGEDLASGDVQCREQVGRPVALVVMGHRARPAADHRQARLGRSSAWHWVFSSKLNTAALVGGLR